MQEILIMVGSGVIDRGGGGTTVVRSARHNSWLKWGFLAGGGIGRRGVSVPWSRGAFGTQQAASPRPSQTGDGSSAHLNALS
jgi:hypothetical protein